MFGMQNGGLQAEPPSLDVYAASEPVFIGQFPSFAPSNRCAGFDGSDAIDDVFTRAPPSETWVGGSTQGAGEQVIGSARTGPRVWPLARPARRNIAAEIISAMVGERNTVLASFPLSWTHGRDARAYIHSHFSRMPPTTSCMLTRLLLSIHAAMK